MWLQSSLMGPTVDDFQQQATSREEDEYRSEDSLGCRSPTGKNEKWSREEILEQQRQQNERLLLLRRREGLLDITVRTVNLVRRNQQLQNRLAALQAETRAFIRLVHFVAYCNKSHNLDTKNRIAGLENKDSNASTPPYKVVQSI